MPSRFVRLRLTRFECWTTTAVGGRGRPGAAAWRAGREQRGQRAREATARGRCTPAGQRSGGRRQRGIGPRPAAPGMIAVGSSPEPLLEQRAVHAAEVASVQPGCRPRRGWRGPGTRRPSCPLAVRADDEARSPAAPWSVPARAVLLGPAAELAPHLDQHPVVEAAASRSRWKARIASQVRARLVGERGLLVRVGVVAARRGPVTQLSGRPRADQRRQRRRACGRSRCSGRRPAGS